MTDPKKTKTSRSSGTKTYSVADMEAALRKTLARVKNEDPPRPEQLSVAQFVADHRRELELAIQDGKARGWTMASIAKSLSEDMSEIGITVQGDTIAKAARTKSRAAKAKKSDSSTAAPAAATAPSASARTDDAK